MISLITAASENNAIGKDHQLLWDLPDDMKFFNETTKGMIVVMGRITYEDMGKPLPGRINIVITRNEDWQREDVFVAKDIEEALKLAVDFDGKEIFIIGGGEIYKQTMPLADRIYITRVHAELEGDTYFPEMDASVWELKNEENHAADEEHAFAFSFQTWEKKQES